MDSPFTGALVEQAENLFVRRKSKLLGLAIEEEKEQRRVQLEVLELQRNEGDNDTVVVTNEFQDGGGGSRKSPERDSVVGKTKRKGKIDRHGRKSSSSSSSSNSSGSRRTSKSKSCLIDDNDHNTTESSNGEEKKSSSEHRVLDNNIEIDEDRWAVPTVCPKDGELGEAQVTSWREQGFAIVQELLPMHLLEAVRKDAKCTFPGILIIIIIFNPFAHHFFLSVCIYVVFYCY